MAAQAHGKSRRDGLSLVEPLRMFPDDATAEKQRIENRWPKESHCPYCGSTRVLTGAGHQTTPFRCREKCGRKRFSVHTKTVMEACAGNGRQPGWPVGGLLQSSWSPPKNCAGIIRSSRCATWDWPAVSEVNFE